MRMRKNNKKKIADGSLFFFSFVQLDKRRKRNGRRKRFPRFLRTEGNWKFIKKAFFKKMIGKWGTFKKSSRIRFT